MFSRSDLSYTQWNQQIKQNVQWSLPLKKHFTASQILYHKNWQVHLVNVGNTSTELFCPSVAQ